MNKITVLTNNVILIGDTEPTDSGVVIKKPYSIQGGNGNPFLLTPFLEAHIGQNVPKLELKNEHILCSVEAENNDLLQGYLQQISGIEVPKQEIILG